MVSFPLLLDKKAGAPLAVVTSVRVLRHSPRVIPTGEAIVTALLVLWLDPDAAEADCGDVNRRPRRIASVSPGGRLPPGIRLPGDLENDLADMARAFHPRMGGGGIGQIKLGIHHWRDLPGL